MPPQAQSPGPRVRRQNGLVRAELGPPGQGCGAGGKEGKASSGSSVESSNHDRVLSRARVVRSAQVLRLRCWSVWRRGWPSGEEGVGGVPGLEWVRSAVLCQGRAPQTNAPDWSGGMRSDEVNQRGEEKLALPLPGSVGLRWRGPEALHVPGGSRLWNISVD